VNAKRSCTPITNLTSSEADAGQLAALIRGHWAIENSIHWVRDMTFGEDAHRARTGNAPAVLACIRNLVTTALRLAGAVKHRRRPTRSRPETGHHPAATPPTPKTGQTFDVTEPFARVNLDWEKHVAYDARYERGRG